MADRIQPVASGSELYFYFDRGPYVKGTMTSAEGVSEFNAFLRYKVHIRLEKPIALEKKTGFSFKDESWNLGNGSMI